MDHYGAAVPGVLVWSDAPPEELAVSEMIMDCKGMQVLEGSIDSLHVAILHLDTLATMGALFLRWCARTGRHWHDGIGQFVLFITWLRHAGPRVLTGPGCAPARSERRVNGVLTAVRGLVVHAVASGAAPAGLVPLLYEVADQRDLPDVARGECRRSGVVRAHIRSCAGTW